MTWRNLSEEIESEFSSWAGGADYAEGLSLLKISRVTRPDGFRDILEEEVRRLEAAGVALTTDRLLAAAGMPPSHAAFSWLGLSMKALGGWKQILRSRGPRATRKRVREYVRVKTRPSKKKKQTYEQVMSVANTRQEWQAADLVALTECSPVLVGRAMRLLGFEKKETTRRGVYELWYSTSQTTSEKSPSSITATSP